MNRTLLKTASTGLAGAAAMATGSQAYGAVVTVTAPATITSTNALGTPITEFFDVNGDGISDLQLTVGVDTTYKSAYGGVSGSYVAYNTFGKVNQVVGYVGTFGNYATRLAAGATVSPTSAFVYGNYLTILGSRFAGKNYGQFRTRGFLGFEFAAADGEHFGYLELLSTVAGSSAATLSSKLNFYSAAYESTPGVAITIPGAVPEPSSLAALVFGAAGLAGAVAYRRKKTAQVAA